MAMTLANLITEVRTNGPTEGPLDVVAVVSGATYSAVSGGTAIAFGPPASLVTPSASAPAMRSLMWLCERAWKHQEENGVAAGAEFITRRAKEVESADLYSPSNTPVNDLQVTYTLTFQCKQHSSGSFPDVNDILIAGCRDLT